MSKDWFQNKHNLMPAIGNSLPVAQGTAGLGSAIEYFSSLGLTVLLPLNDNQDYDLVVEIGTELKKVQCKTTDSTRYQGIYRVDLRRTRANRTEVKRHKFEGSNSDLTFTLTSKGDRYLIPSKELDGKSELSLGKDQDKYLVGLPLARQAVLKTVGCESLGGSTPSPTATRDRCDKYSRTPGCYDSDDDLAHC